MTQHVHTEIDFNNWLHASYIYSVFTNTRLVDSIHIAVIWDWDWESFSILKSLKSINFASKTFSIFVSK